MPADYSGQNLRGRNFRGENLKGANFKSAILKGANFKKQDLTGADFSYADIRSADFSGANLKDANLSHTKAGLQRRWAISLVIFSLLLSIVSGFGSAIASAYLGLFLFKSSLHIFTSVVSLIVLALFSLITIYRGLVAAFGFLTMAGAVGAPVTVVAAVIVEGAVYVGGPVAGAVAGIVVGASAVAVAAAVAQAVVGSSAGAVAAAVVGSSAGAVAATTWGGAVAQAGAVAGVWARVVTMALVGAVTVIVAGLYAYVGWRAIVKDKKQALIRNIAVTITAIGGTSFRAADLTNANFTRATLKNANFREATLTRTCWFGVKQLDLARASETYFENLQVQELLQTKQGQGKNFDRLDLRGINLQGANLVDASFIGANLSQANLQDADLSRAKLVQTQLDQTDLTGAILTGAYIEQWNISTDTKLHGIRCDYIFMRLPPEKRPDFLALPPSERLDENPRRKPDDWNRNFVDGEFADFIAPLVQTLDLYHNNVVDPRFIAIAFQQLKETHPEAELEITSIEKKGKNRDKIHIKAETSPQADSSTLHADYFSSVEYLQSLPPQAQQALLVDRGAMIQMLAGLLGSSSTPQPEISIVNNNSQTQDNKNQNEHGNINTDGGNYNEDIQGNYIEGDYSEN